MSEQQAPVQFELTNGEKLSPLWARLKAYFEAELALTRSRNDNAKLTEHETATLRGDIKRLKAMLALGDDRPLTE